MPNIERSPYAVSRAGRIHKRELDAARSDIDEARQLLRLACWRFQSAIAQVDFHTIDGSDRIHAIAPLPRAKNGASPWRN